MIIRVINLQRKEYMDFRSINYAPMQDKAKRVEISSIERFPYDGVIISTLMSPVGPSEHVEDKEDYAFEMWVNDVSYWKIENDGYLVLGLGSEIPKGYSIWNGLGIEY